MVIRTPRDIGAAIRDMRRRRKLDQHELAERIGVSRQWVIEVEKGKPRAEVGLVLRALNALGIALAVAPEEDAAPETSDPIGPDIDQIIDRARGDRR